MSLIEVVGDLLTLEELAAQEDDPERRRSLDAVRDHVADRDRGAKVSEVAQVLGISQPTVRAWIEAGVLEPRGDTTPVRVDVLSLAAVKRALDLLREHGQDRNLLITVMRILRDRAALADSEEGFADLAAGRVVPLGDDLLAEIDELRRRDRKSRSKSR
ncbi:MAG: helix-turn-helix domain-containing protein [Acidimicrobiales bacterium]